MKIKKTTRLVSFVALLATFMLMSGCGKKNESGKRRSSSSSSASLPTGPGGVGGFGGFGSGGNNIMNQVPCSTGFGTQRIHIQAQAPFPGAPGAPRYGMTSEGDFMVANSNGNSVMLDIFLCPRSAFVDPMNGAPIQPQAQINSYFPMESYGCSFQGLQSDVTIISPLYNIPFYFYFREVGLTHPQLCQMQAI